MAAFAFEGCFGAVPAPDSSEIDTYTSCFRVYRRKAILDLDILEPGFLGIAELIGKLDLGGGTIAEYPTTLDSRILGRSKMKTLRTILGHLGVMGRLAWLRVSRRRNLS